MQSTKRFNQNIVSLNLILKRQSAFAMYVCKENKKFNCNNMQPSGAQKCNKGSCKAVYVYKLECGTFWSIKKMHLARTKGLNVSTPMHLCKCDAKHTQQDSCSTFGQSNYTFYLHSCNSRHASWLKVYIYAIIKFPCVVVINKYIFRK